MRKTCVLGVHNVLLNCVQPHGFYTPRKFYTFVPHIANSFFHGHKRFIMSVVGYLFPTNHRPYYNSLFYVKNIT
jgi:hypothetical protein